MTIEGSVFANRYVVGELLGRGGMAEVHLATDRVLDRPVAFKVLGGWLANDATFVERFRREALAAARISHPNLVAVFDAGSEGDMHYIVMEYVAGETLADVLRTGALDPARATRIATDLADALAVAHAARMVHRDVKPANVMQTPEGRTKLMDLGIARSLDGESITHASSILGTAGYVSPEQARGDPVDHRSDIYSLGCVLYEMLTGRPPFEAADPLAVAYKHVHEEPVLPTSLDPSIPPALETVTLRAMAKDPEARFQSAADMASALADRTAPAAQVAATTPLSPVGATTPLPAAIATDNLPRRADRSPRGRRLMPLLLALAALALLGGLAFAIFGGEPPSALDGPSGSPSRSITPTPSPSPTPSPTPSPSVSPSPTLVVDSVEGAMEALFAVVDDGVSEENITSDAAEEIRARADKAFGTFLDGDTEKAIEQLEDLRDEVDKMVDDERIANSQEQKLDKAIEDLAEQMYFASSDDG